MDGDSSSDDELGIVAPGGIKKEPIPGTDPAGDEDAGVRARKEAEDEAKM
jgi:hypothetical protein